MCVRSPQAGLSSTEEKLPPGDPLTGAARPFAGIPFVRVKWVIYMGREEIR